jgi:exportin-1
MSLQDPAVQAQIAQLLNFGTPEAPAELTPQTLATLEALVGTLYNPATPSQEAKIADDCLKQFKEHENAWFQCKTVLDQSQSAETKFFALSCLDDVIKTQWRGLAPAQSEGMKEFIVETVISKSSSFATLQAEGVFIKKLDQILIQIVKQDWPDRWPSFIQDIVGASGTSESLCENNMVILRLLSEEVFENKNTMTEAKSNRLKQQLREQFDGVFQLCEMVMSESEQPTLLNETLHTLLKFMTWINMEFIFGPKLIPTLVTKFFPVPLFRNRTLQCLTEIVGISTPAYDEPIYKLFEQTMLQLTSILPASEELPMLYARGNDEQQRFVNTLANFMATFLKHHGNLLEVEQYHPVLVTTLEYLVHLSRIAGEGGEEIFKICLEYWNSLAASLFNEAPAPQIAPTGLMLKRSSPRHELYRACLIEVRRIMVERMSKPEEVLVVQKEDEVIREQVKDTDAMEQYKFMRETLVFLTHLDVDSTEAIMTAKLSKQVDNSEYSWAGLNTLCWAIGSISGAMNEDNEKRFLVTVIKDLLGLCERKTGKNHKAIIASNIMYIVGQYPRFLRAHWKFLKTVVTKLFEFMHEPHEGVQDMACDTFIKIAQKCRKHFVTTQVGDYNPFIVEILESMQQIIMDLEPHQVHTFYEAIGHMIYAQTNPSTRAELIKQLMLNPNKIWAQIIQEAHQNASVLEREDVVGQLVNILKMNVRACTSIRNDFISQLGVIYMDILLIYQHMSQYIAKMIAAHGEQAVKTPLIKSMRLVKREALHLIGLWISMSDNPEVVMQNFIPPLLEAVLGDYQNSIPQARDEQVLATMVKIVKKLQGNITGSVLDIFGAIFESTISMITQDFVEFPEHRIHFYDLMLAIVKYCFDAFAQLTPDQLDMVFRAITWGFQHLQRHAAETSLTCMKLMLEKVMLVGASNPAWAQEFYGKFYLQLLEHVFGVLTDSLHYGELDQHAILLADMFGMLENGVVSIPLNQEDPTMNNQAFVQGYIMRQIAGAFSNLQEGQLQVITQGFFSYNQDVTKYTQHLRDFLIESKEVAGEDMAQIYLVERKRQADQADQMKKVQYDAIGGMQNPFQRGDEDDMA